MPYTLYLEDSTAINEQWFALKLSSNGNNPYEACYREEVAALQAFYNRKTSLEQAAAAITQPISKSPIQDLGDYSDDAVALGQLWNLLKDALVEWPSSRTADVVALLSAITKVTDSIHRGQLLDDTDENPRSWAQLPWFHMVWSDAFWRTPGQIVRQATDATARQHEREVYIKQQDVEARLVAARIFGCKPSYPLPIPPSISYSLATGDRAPRYMIRTLERKPGPEDSRDAANDGEAENQLKLDFQIPAASRWLEHNGDRLYSSLVELKNWDKNKAPFEMMQFDQPSERWEFWKKRFVISKICCAEISAEAPTFVGCKA